MLVKQHSGEEQDLTSLRDEIARNMDDGIHYFMRLSSTSGKNERHVSPMKNADDIMDNLIKNKIFLQREYYREKDTYLILIPWNDKIEKRNEFRIFVKNGKLTGITQQWWSQCFNYSQEELILFQHSLENISFLDKIPYPDYVGDVYIENGECKLIEINPFGAHIGAGSGLYNWVDDFDILYNLKSDLQFRYLSIVRI